MSVVLEAPYPGVETVSILPNPQFGDGEGLTATVSSKRAMDGTLYTYVKSKNGRRRLSLTFQMTRMKAIELSAFIQSYFASKVRLTNHLGRVWVGNFVNNPFELETAGRAPTYPGGAVSVVRLEFEGEEQ